MAILEDSFTGEKVLFLAPKLRGYEISSIGPEEEYMLPRIAEDVRAWILEVNPESKNLFICLDMIGVHLLVLKLQTCFLS